MTQPQRYRKKATVSARRLEPGETVTVQTLEGPATATGPDAWLLTNHTQNREQYFNEHAFFDGLNGYTETGGVDDDGLKVYRKKPTADVLAYQVDADDHAPVTMWGVEEPFVPSRGEYWVLTNLDDSNERACRAGEFVETYEPSAG